MSTPNRVESAIETLTETHTRLWWSAFILLLAVYLPTAAWTVPMDPDALTMAVTARQLAKTGSPVAPGWEEATTAPYRGSFASFTETDAGPVGQYPPGAPLLAVPLYLVTPSPLEEAVMGVPGIDEIEPISVPMPTLWQATLAAALSTSAAIATLTVLFDRPLGSRRALLAGLLAGFGTSAWSVSASALFMHGPAMLFLALVVWFTDRERLWAAGLAMGGAILIRPHLAFAAAAIGILLGATRRSPKPVLQLGTGSALGAAGFLAYNEWAFATTSVSGGYEADFADRMASTPISDYLTNLVGAFISNRGILFWSPFLILLLLSLRLAWRSSTPSERILAIGGVVFLLVQFRLNRYNPGNRILYRYQLESLTLAAPLLVWAWRPWPDRPRQIAWWVTTRLSVAAQAFAALF